MHSSHAEHWWKVGIPTWIYVGMLTFVAWLPVLWGGFLHDDYMLVDTGIQTSLAAGRMGRLGGALFFQMMKNDPWLYHLFVIALHSANGILVYLIIRKLTKQTKVAFWSAIAYSLAYLATDAVFWTMTVTWSVAIYTAVLILISNQQTERFWLRIGLPLVGILFVGPFFHEGVVAIPVMVGCYFVIVKRDVKYAILSLVLLAPFALSIFLQAEVCKTMGYRLHSSSLIAVFFQNPAGVLSNLVSAILFLVVSPWYQVLRLAGLGAVWGILLSLGLAGLLAIVTKPFQRNSAGNNFTIAWLALSIIVCLLPGTVLGLAPGIKWPTMGSRYLYPAWGIFVILASVVFFSKHKRTGSVRQLSRVLVGGFVLSNALLLGISEYGFLKRSYLDRKLIGLVSESAAACSEEIPSRGPVVLTLSGVFLLGPFILPSPPPDLLQKNPGGIGSMLRMSGINIDGVRVVKTAPPNALPLVMDCKDSTFININVSKL